MVFLEKQIVNAIKKIKSFAKRHKFWTGMIIFLSSVPTAGYSWLILICYFPFMWMYRFWYYRSKGFNTLKLRLNEYVQKCNDLNAHIEQLKTTFRYRTADFGHSEIISNAGTNRKSKREKDISNPYIHDCSQQVFRNAKSRPIEYVCKYFDITPNEENLELFERVLNNFSAAEEGKRLLTAELKQIQEDFKKDIPILIRILHMEKFMSKVGFQTVDIRTPYFPKYYFRTTTPAGNSTSIQPVVLDIRNLNAMVEYIGNKVSYRKSAAGQRSLMTTSLRKEIKKRDNYTCKTCGISTYKEPHLLLEIDHIIPIAKGGLTKRENLQTLCWMCNRSKGTKIQT